MNPQFPIQGGNNTNITNNNNCNNNSSSSTSKPFPPFDMDQMSDTPHRGAHHRRAQSETFFRFPDDIFDVSDVDFSVLDFPTPTAAATTNNLGRVDAAAAAAPMAVDSSRSDDSSSDNRSTGTATTRPPVAAPAHLRSLSVDADFFDGLSFGGGGGGMGGDGGGRVDAAAAGGFGGGGEGAGGKRVGLHRRNNSMDGAFSSSCEADSLLDGVKKAMAPEKLAELALIDPKRAKRILANRQSAARSKERKIRYTSELERKVQTLQTEATTLSAQVTMLQRDTTGLTAENRELQLRLQAMEQQAHLRDALNEALREEVQRLRLATGQVPMHNNNNASGSSSRGPRPFGGGQQNQQPQFNDQSQATQQQHQPNFLDFNHRV